MQTKGQLRVWGRMSIRRLNIIRWSKLDSLTQLPFPCCEIIYRRLPTFTHWQKQRMPCWPANHREGLHNTGLPSFPRASATTRGRVLSSESWRKPLKIDQKNVIRQCRNFGTRSPRQAYRQLAHCKWLQQRTKCAVSQA